MEYKISREKLLSESKRSDEAKEILSKLFPEAFELNVDDVTAINDLELYINETGPNWIYELLPGKWARDKAEWLYRLIIANRGNK